MAEQVCRRKNELNLIFLHQRMDLKTFKTEASSRKPHLKKLFSSLKRKKSSDLDDKFHAFHDEVFAEFDCLSCANCCKTTSPIFLNTDIERISKHLKLRPANFIKEYLRIDEDGDYVLHRSPCPFLGPDNCCSIYESRPKACREYPHTNRKKMHQLLDLTYQNTQVCPAVLQIVERLEKSL